MTNLDMNRSRSGKMVLDDVEAQLGSQWLFKLKTTLLDNEKRAKSKGPDFCILKVPEYIRQPSEDFTPSAWRYGLHNCNNLDMSGSEAVKISFANAVGLVGEEFDKFCEYVVEDPKSMLQCYGLQEQESVWPDEVIQKLLALDALFLALFMDLFVSAEYALWTPRQWASFSGNVSNYSRYGSYGIIYVFDACKYENQIPFKLIERACKYLQKSRLEAADANLEPNEENLANLYREWAKASTVLVRKLASSFINLHFDVDETELANAKHVLGLVYKAICGTEGMQRECDDSQESYIHIPSATELKASGIRIKALPVSKGTLSDTSYESNCLSLPVMNVYDETISFIRNMAKYEEHLNRCMFHDYIFIMIDLIKTPMDLEFLTKCGVLRNQNSNRAFNNWIGVGKHALIQPSSSIHNEMKLAINRRCEFKRHRLWYEFHKQFCSRPWLVVSALTVIVITTATLGQTYTAIIGSHGMKPQFSP